jgi:acid phosphatase type 7
MKRFAMIGVILCLQPAAPAMQAAPAPTTYYPSKDTYVKSDQPAASFGTAVYLSAEEDPTVPATERMYIHFTIPGLAGQTVTSAILRVWVNRENGGGGTGEEFELFGVTSPWADTLTWTQEQTVTHGSLVTTMPVLDYGASNTLAPSVKLEFVVTPLVQSWASGTANEGILIRLAPATKADMRFGSMESVERPELIVTYGAAAPPPPPPPPPGPPPPPPAPRTSKVGGEDNPCGCGTASTPAGAGLLVALAAAILILAARRP